MILTVINLGQDHLLFPLTNEKDIRRLWAKFVANAKVADMEETSWDEERTYWEQQLCAKEKYAIETIQEYAAWLLEGKTNQNSVGA